MYVCMHVCTYVCRTKFAHMQIYLCSVCMCICRYTNVVLKTDLHQHRRVKALPEGGSKGSRPQTLELNPNAKQNKNPKS